MLATSESFSGVGLPRILDLHAGRRQIQLNAMATLQTSGLGPRESAQRASPGTPAGNPWDTRGIPKRATAGDAHPLVRKTIAGESQSGTPNQTHYNSRKLLWRTLSHGNSLGPAHEVEPRMRRTMTYWPRYTTAILHGVGWAQNANMQNKHNLKHWMRS